MKGNILMIELLQETTKNPLELIGRSAGVCYGSDISDIKKNDGGYVEIY